MHAYHVVDVFAESRLAGNPLTVVLDAGDLPVAEMQALARETNHSETTFVVASAPTNGAWPVRIFTPAVEIPFAGHPTLGTAAVLARELGAKVPLALDLAVGRVPVTQEQDLWWMTQPEAEFLNYAQPAFVARALNLTMSDLDARFMPQAVSTGIPFLIVPVETLDALERARFELSRLRELMPRVGAEAVYAFARGSRGGSAALHARSFTAAFGIPEDPATGSAAGALAAFLSHHRYFGDARVDCAVEQGLEIGRPSKLHLRAQTEGPRTRVRVGGRVVPVARGQIL